MGDPAAAADDGIIQRYFRAISETTLGRGPISDLHVHCTAALAAFCLRPDAVLQQPGRQPEPDHQSLFPTPGGAVIVSHGRGGGLCNRLRGTVGNGRFLRYQIDPRSLAAAFVPAPGFGQCAGGGTLAFSAKCEIPGYPLRSAVPDAILDVCHPSSIFKLDHP